MTAYALTDLPERMQAKIAVEGDCWIWIGAKNNKGYGSASAGKNHSVLAHRKSYTLTKGDIPEGLQIDHLCENTSCVNPAHLEAVSREEHRSRIGHENLKPIYAPPPRRASDEEVAAFRGLFDPIREGMRRYEAMSRDERAADDARRHRLHVMTGTRCACQLEAVSS